MPLKRLPAYLGESRALLAIAGPMMIAQLAQIGTGVVDTIMAGRYSAMDLAAVAIGYNIWLPIYLLFIGVMLGATTIIAQDFGAGRIQRIRDSLPQALWLALALGLIAGPLCYFAEPLLTLLDLDDATHTKSLAYLQATAFGMPAAAVFQALRCHTQGIGIMRPFAVASVLGFIANIPLNYAFIYGKWGFPELGAAGCGWATAISMWLGPVLISFYMTRAETLKPYLPALKLVAPDIRTIKEIMRLGLPMGLTFFLEISVFSIVALCIATLGNTAMASHQIAINVWDVVFMPLISIGSAMATRVGHAIGGGDKAKVNLAIICGTSMTLLVGLMCMVILLAAPGPIVKAYTTDTAIHSMAITLIRLAALFIMLDAGQVAASFSLRAFKDTRFPFVVLCIAYWLITLPLGYWLGIVAADNALDGTVGFWKSMIAGIFVSGVLVIWRLYYRLQKPLPVS
ncbi:MAG: MATE family efflux transporter [Gammaproteobacteria bacterium]|nr:MAG: MATE family efflux transporter [Gammaproteobacteria bacterium]RLA60235.1 MAG: MATE family efflux transporter [Gammaproteobacteria bacterium]